jgi:hypothetical protein
MKREEAMRLRDKCFLDECEKPKQLGFSFIHNNQRYDFCCSLHSLVKLDRLKVQYEERRMNGHSHAARH